MSSAPSTDSTAAPSASPGVANGAAAGPVGLGRVSDGAIAAARTVSVVLAGKPGSYGMFQLRDLRNDGATLGGVLLLELDEELTLRLGEGDPQLELQARVTRVDRGAPGIEVVFIEVSAADRQRLEARVREWG